MADIYIAPYQTATTTYPSYNGYTCYTCGVWVNYGTTHTCWATGSAAVSWFAKPCDHCLCIRVPRSKLKTGPGLSASSRTKPHAECCHCGRWFAKS